MHRPARSMRSDQSFTELIDANSRLPRQFQSNLLFAVCVGVSRQVQPVYVPYPGRGNLDGHFDPTVPEQDHQGAFPKPRSHRLASALSSIPTLDTRRREWKQPLISRGFPNPSVKMSTCIIISSHCPGAWAWPSSLQFLWDLLHSERPVFVLPRSSEYF